MLSVFAVLVFFMTFRSVGRLGSHIVGDSGDSLLNAWIIGWVQHAIPMGWHEIWNTSIFFPAKNTLAFSDPLLPVAIVEWPLRLLLGRVLGLNVLMLAAQTAGLWFTYRLALRLTSSWPASFIAALTFGFASVQLSQLGHSQLTVTAFFVPLIVLLVVEYFDAPTMFRGAAIGVALGLLATSAAYYTVLMAVSVTVLVVAYLLICRSARSFQFLRGIGVAVLVAVVITLPVARQYVGLQDDPHFRRDPVPELQAHLGDFLAPSDSSELLADIEPFAGYVRVRSVERQLFPGVIALTFGAVGLIVVLRLARPQPRRARSRQTAARNDGERDARLALVIGAAGLASLVLAFGSSVMIFGVDIPLPWRVLDHGVPGFSGIRVTSRLALMAQCSLAVMAAFGLRALLRLMSPRIAFATAIVLAGLVLAETAVKVQLVEVPSGAAVEAVNRELAARPPGVVVELPMRAEPDLAPWPFTEVPRQYLSLIDNNDRVNGYSGFAPEGHDQFAATANTFPAAEALAEFRRDRVRYVVLRLRVIGQLPPAMLSLLKVDGTGRYTRATAEKMISQIPAEKLRRVTKLPGAYLIELRPGRKQ